MKSLKKNFNNISDSTLALDASSGVGILSQCNSSYGIQACTIKNVISDSQGNITIKDTIQSSTKVIVPSLSSSNSESLPKAQVLKNSMNKNLIYNSGSEIKKMIFQNF